MRLKIKERVKKRMKKQTFKKRTKKFEEMESVVKNKESESIVKNNENGITLIALVITVIVLLILCEASHKISYGKLKVMGS